MAHIKNDGMGLEPILTGRQPDVLTIETKPPPFYYKLKAKIKYNKDL